MPGTDMCIKIGGWVRSEVTYGTNGSFDHGCLRHRLQQPHHQQPVDAGTRLHHGRCSRTDRLWRGPRLHRCRRSYEQQRATRLERRSVRTAPSCSGQASRPACRCRSSTSIRRRRCSIAPATFRTKIPATAAGGSGVIPPSSAAVSPPRCRRKSGAPAQIIDFSGPRLLRRSVVPARSLSPLPIRRRLALASSPATAAPPTPGTAAGSRPTSSAICASIKLGAARRSWAPCTKTMPPTTAPLPSTGGPCDEWGWVVGGGIKINTPFISPGDYFIAEANYTQGALKYLWDANLGRAEACAGRPKAYGVAAIASTAARCGRHRDGLPADHAAGASTSPTSTTGRRNGTSRWCSTACGRSTAVRPTRCCARRRPRVPVPAPRAVAAAGCNNNWDDWGVGSRLQWDVTKSFYIGVEAIYQNFDSATTAGRGAARRHCHYPGELRRDDRVEPVELGVHDPHAQGLPALIA